MSAVPSLPSMPGLLLVLAAGACLCASPARADGVCTGAIPAALRAPAGQALAFETSAEGVQIYACAAAAGGQAWAFQAPEARLLDGRGQPAGKHYAGPTWEAPDGSKVVGAKVEGDTPDASAIPWLLLRAASTAGAGRMAQVTFVQRIRTAGGLAPASACGPANTGEVARVPYTAVYCFYAKEGSRHD